MTDTLSIVGGDPSDPGDRPGGTLPIVGERSAEHAVPAAAAGDRIGPYTLVRALAAGSFGQVWLAERQKPYFQRVALKLLSLKGDAAVREGLFEQERQVLASLEHPGIAKLLDGGTTEAGQPFYVMEFVDGQPINEFCDSLGLDLRARMELFLQVCDAVAHAHSRFILHRDLKPGNILACREERRGADGRVENRLHAKVIDFGLAKSLQQGAMGERQYELKHGAPVGSPLYMSPEQWQGGDVDARTDVYSLGVVLYEMLAGVLPMDASEFEALDGASRLKAIRDHVPMRPSMRLSHLRARKVEGALEGAVARVAGARATDWHRLLRSLAHELDWIPERAMQRDREARYRDVAQLADDVRNWLQGRPLLAVPDSAIYRARKVVTRSPMLVAASAAAILFLVVGAIVSTWFGISELRARHLAEERERQVRQIADFQQSMLERVSPQDAGRGLFDDIVRRGSIDGDATVLGERLGHVNATDVATAFIERMILRPAAEALADPSYEAQPEVQAQLQEALATISLGFDRGEFGLDMVEAALATRGGVDGAPPRAAATLLTQRSRALLQLQRIAESIEAASIAVERASRALGDASPVTAEARQMLARALVADSRVNEAIPLVREAAAALSRSGGKSDASAIEARESLAALLVRAGSDEARDEAERLLRADLSIEGMRPRARIHALANLADVLSQRALVDGVPADRRATLHREAATLMEEASGLHDGLFGESHSESLLMQARAANAFALAGRPGDARALRERSLRLLDGSSTVTDETAVTLMTNAGMEMSQDPEQREDGARLIERALARARRVGDGGSVEISVMLALSHVRELQGRIDDAVNLRRAAIARHRDAGVPATDRDLIVSVYDLAGVLLAAGRAEDAVIELESAAAGAVKRHETQVSQASRLLIGRLLEAYAALNRRSPGSIAPERILRAERWLAAMQAMGPA